MFFFLPSGRFVDPRRLIAHLWPLMAKVAPQKSAGQLGKIFTASIQTVVISERYGNSRQTAYHLR